MTTVPSLTLRTAEFEGVGSTIPMYCTCMFRDGGYCDVPSTGGMGGACQDVSVPAMIEFGTPDGVLRRNKNGRSISMGDVHLIPAGTEVY